MGQSTSNINYNLFKTPFFRVGIGDSYGNGLCAADGVTPRYISENIARLIEKIDIQETFSGASIVKLHFVEGSRELSGKNSNYPGWLADLAYTDAFGINGAFPDDWLASKFPRYLLQERNMVHIVWGYKEDPHTVRHIKTRIIVIDSEFPENGSPKITVTCEDTQVFADQMALNNGIPFNEKISEQSGELLFNLFVDKPVQDVVKQLAAQAGITNTIISKNLEISQLDKEHFKVWVSGMSYQQFMSELAKQCGAYYKIQPNGYSSTHEDILIFVNKQDYESLSLAIPNEYLNYKNPNSIIKSISVKADFGMPIGSSEASLDVNGSPVFSDGLPHGGKQAVLYTVVQDETALASKVEVHMDFDPTGSNPVPMCKSLKDSYLQEGRLSEGFFTARMNVTPIADGGLLRTFSEIKQAELSKAVEVTLSTIGYTYLIPGTVIIRGIGKRYSGSIRLMTVTHTLDRNGYTTSAMGTTYALSEGGTVVTQALKVNENESSPTSQVVVIRSAWEKTGDSVTTLQDQQATAKAVHDFYLGSRPGAKYE
jgi:hypothetical protein